ncbi:MAG: BolA family protein [Kangiellaceae bacterium]|jgi:BolA protein|nr:BolA family protein [Kangiellaceae bacterium]
MSIDNSQRIVEITERLTKAFNPTQLEVIDDSHLHAGHAGAKTGMGHFTVVIGSQQLADKRAVQSHQMIYQALGEMMKTDIHALSIKIVK